MEFYFPTETGEQLAFASAAVTALIGLLILFAPGITMRMLGLAIMNGRREGLAAMRFGGGLLIGLGASVVMLAQPMLYLAYGAALAAGWFGLVLSLLSDHSATWRTVLSAVVVGLLQALHFVYVFGLV